MSRKWRKWYQNEVDKEIKGVGSRGKVKHNERSDQLFLERMNDVGGRARVTTSTSRTLNGYEVMKVKRLCSYDNFVGKGEELVFEHSLILSQWRERSMGVI